jgi:hypothetical protein
MHEEPETAGPEADADDLLEFLADHAPDIPQEAVFVPSWKRRVTLRGMTARERDQWEADNIERAAERQRARMANGGNRAQRRAAAALSRREQQLQDAADQDLDNFRARLIAATIWSPRRGRYLHNERGRQLLGEQAATIMDMLYDTAQRVNGMSKKDIEEMEKNFGDGGAGDGSSSGSPDTSDQPLPN